MFLAMVWACGAFREVVAKSSFSATGPVKGPRFADFICSATAAWNLSRSPSGILFDCGSRSSTKMRPAMHALVAARLGDVSTAEHYVRATAEIDLGSPITSSAGGVHIAALGGLWLAVVFGVAGFRPKGEELVLNPSMPERWQALAFRIQWRGRIIHVRIDRVGNAVSATLEKGDAVPLQVGDSRVVLESGTSCDMHYPVQ